MAKLKIALLSIAMTIATFHGLVLGAETQVLDPKATKITLPDKIPWKRRKVGTGILDQAVLLGDLEKPGLYVVMHRWHKNSMARPHWHLNDRYITVLKGTWWVGTGTNFDTEKGVAVPEGSYVVHPGKEIHWDGAKNEEVWLLIVGEGPETATPASKAPPPPH